MKSLPHCGQENRETVSNSAIDFAFLNAKASKSFLRHTEFCSHRVSVMERSCKQKSLVPRRQGKDILTFCCPETNTSREPR